MARVTVTRSGGTPSRRTSATGAVSAWVPSIGSSARWRGRSWSSPCATEQVGRRPARTVYRITDEGLRELRILREHAIRDLHYGPDAFGVALLFGRTWDRAELIGLLRVRRQTIAAELEAVKADCTQLEARGAIGPLDVALFRRRAMQLEAELRWHDEFDRVLPSMPEPPGRADEGIGDDGPAPEPESPPPAPKRRNRKPKTQEPPRGSGK